jgi:hypothetical protein
VLLAENAESIGKDRRLKWKESVRVAAFVYSQKDRKVDVSALGECLDQIRGENGPFSALRGAMSLVVAGLASVSDNPQLVLSNSATAYTMLREAKFSSSPYLAVASCLIALHADSPRFPSVVERTRAFFDGMKADHRFLTGGDDYISCAMLGLSRVDPAIGVARIEEIYENLRRKLGARNGVQALAQVLTLGGGTAEAESRATLLRDALKNRKARLEGSAGMPILGLFALLPVDVERAALDVAEARDFLGTLKGFGALSGEPQERLILAAATVAGEYASHLPEGALTATLSSSMTGITIAGIIDAATQAAEVVVATTAS